MHYSDTDVNGHVNNARYADWLCDALGLETMREYRVKTMRLSYAAETMKGSPLCFQVTLSAEECERSALATDAVQRM